MTRHCSPGVSQQDGRGELLLYRDTGDSGTCTEPEVANRDSRQDSNSEPLLHRDTGDSGTCAKPEVADRGWEAMTALA